MADDPYAALGVARTASDAEIKKAYRRIAKTDHPDLTADTAAHERFKAASSAYDLLKDADQRARFDRGEIDAQGQERPQRRYYRDFAEAGDNPYRGQANYGDFSDVFDDLFGGRARPGAGAGGGRGGWPGGGAGRGLSAREFYQGGSSLAKGRELTERILAREPALDFLYYSNDIIGAGGLIWARENGIDIPGRLGLAGFNGVDLLDGLPVRLATTDARRLDIGRRAARIVAGKDPRPDDGIVALAPTFMPGDTIRRVP